MNHRISRIPNLLIVAGLFVLTIGFAQASAVSHLSGSFQVMQKTDLGPRTRVRLQLHFANHGPGDLHILRITLWGSSHPNEGGQKACSLVIHTDAAASTTQEFTIPRSEYRLWTHTTRLNLLVAVEGPGGRRATELVRLDRISGGKAD